MLQENDDEPLPELGKDSRVGSKTNREWLQEVKSFAQDFKTFRSSKTSSTPQADLGIGPVNYEVELSKVERINEERIQLLDNAVKLEKIIGDYWLKIEAALMYVVLGKESPTQWLSAAQYFAIRSDLRE